MQASLRSLALAAFLLFAVSGCDRSRDQIIGKWQVVGEGNTMAWEFLQDGTLKSGDNPGKYSFGDNKRLKIQTQFATFVYEIEMTENGMIWKDPNGSRTELKRVP